MSWEGFADQSRDAASGDTRWVYLFSSNIRELYLKDIFEVLAAPMGAHCRFRYEFKYVSGDLRDTWRRNGFVGRTGLVLFSMQHPEGFHTPVFLPIRQIRIEETLAEGKLYVVRFSVMEYLTLKDPHASELRVTGVKEGRLRAERTRNYTEKIQKDLGAEGNPDSGVSAALGPAPVDLLSASTDTASDFTRVVSFLTPMLSPRSAVFWRISGISAGDRSREVKLDRDGSLPLWAGEAYRIEIAHFSVTAPGQGWRVSVSAPECVPCVGQAEIRIKSRYDLTPTRFFAKARDSSIETQIVFETIADDIGPTVRLPVRVRPPFAQSLSSVLLAAGGAMALAFPGILASDNNLGWRVGIGVLGACLAAAGFVLRRGRGLPT